MGPNDTTLCKYVSKIEHLRYLYNRCCFLLCFFLICSSPWFYYVCCMVFVFLFFFFYNNVVTYTFFFCSRFYLVVKYFRYVFLVYILFGEFLCSVSNNIVSKKNYSKNQQNKNSRKFLICCMWHGKNKNTC